MGAALSRINTRLGFDFDAYIRDREELAQDLRCIAADAASHRRLHGSWQVLQGASGVAAGIAGGIALVVAAPVTFGIAPAVGVTAAIVGNSISAASLASSAASYAHGHVVDKDIAKRLQNLRHVIESIAEKDKQINAYVVSKEQEAQELKLQKQKSLNVVDEKDTSVNTDVNSQISTEEEEEEDVKSSKKTKKTPAIQACKSMCEVWEDWDLATKENKKVGYNLPLALIKSTGVILGARSIWQGAEATVKPQDFETALVQTAAAIDHESQVIRQLDLRYLRCIPTARSLPRGRLLHVDGGGGQVKMTVTFHAGILGQMETLQSDSTNAIRLPEGASNIKVRFIDLAGKTVNKVDRANPKQAWVKDEDRKYVLEECSFAHGDGVDAVFVVKGGLTHAYIHKAWDFGRGASQKARDWEWWENAEEESKKVAPKVEERKLARATSIHDNSCGMTLCCLQPEEMLAFSATTVEVGS